MRNPIRSISNVVWLFMKNFIKVNQSKTLFPTIFNYNRSLQFPFDFIYWWLMCKTKYYLYFAFLHQESISTCSSSHFISFIHQSITKFIEYQTANLKKLECIIFFDWGSYVFYKRWSCVVAFFQFILYVWRWTRH